MPKEEVTLTIDVPYGYKVVGYRTPNQNEDVLDHRLSGEAVVSTIVSDGSLLPRIILERDLKPVELVSELRYDKYIDWTRKRHDRLCFSYVAMGKTECGRFDIIVESDGNPEKSATWYIGYINDQEEIEKQKDVAAKDATDE